ncbi:MAG TPA: MFS transporter [Candidatus Acidoferrum sp.]|nr:MFS transporter [Candidatus Acidoferrum sp.]
MIFAAFRVRSFRFQWPADLVTSWAFEMETIILGWYVMVNTGSVLWVTAFGSLQSLGTLAAPMFGVLGDRLGGRIVLCAMRTIYAVLAVVLMLLAAGGWLTPAWVLVVAAVSGIVRSNDLVLRNTLIAETMPSGSLVGALGLSRATADSARVMGALAGAGLSTWLGIGGSYVFVVSCYVASFILTRGTARRRPIPDPSDTPTPMTAPVTATPTATAASGAVAVRAPGPSRWRDLVDGLVRVATTPELLAMMLLAFLINVTAYPLSGGLLPYVAREVFHVGATGLGWLAASFALGGLLGSIVTVVTGGLRRPERVTFVGTAVWYALLLGFGHAHTFNVGLLALFAAGFVQNLAMLSMTTTLLAAAGEGYRGRIMGVRMLAVYGYPLGLVALGFLIERLGYRLTISGAVVTGLVFTFLIAVRWRASVWDRRAAVTSVPQRV